MEILAKPFQSIAEEIEILKSRGLSFTDEDDARQKLLQNNYYSVINGYKDLFLEKTEFPFTEKFLQDTNFNEIYALYEFDNHIRALFLKYILRIEHQLKSVISHLFAEQYRDIKYPDYLDKKNFAVSNKPKKEREFQELCTEIDKVLQQQRDKNNPILIHYEKNYNNIPPWILLSFLSFGMLRHFYLCLDDKIQNNISREFNLRPQILKRYMSVLNTFRNSCAHNERIYNYHFRNPVTINNERYDNIYGILLIYKAVLDSDSFLSFYKDFTDCKNVLANNLKTIPLSDILFKMGIPQNEAIIRNDLGYLDKGVFLSDQEFCKVLNQYILPSIPEQVELQTVKNDDITRLNKKAKLVQKEDSRIYFSQSTTGYFSYYIELSEKKIINEISTLAEEYLSMIIDFLHVFWNSRDLPARDNNNVEIAFPNICEQAYELTICKFLCNDTIKKLSDEYETKKKECSQREGKLSSEERQNQYVSLRELKNKKNNAVLVYDNAQKSLFKIINQMKIWAMKTYEGQKKTFGIILCLENNPSSSSYFDYIEFLKSDYSATINDGINSAIELYSDGSFKNYIQIHNKEDILLPSIPVAYTGFANLCTENKIGIILTITGDILLIKDKKLCFTRHNGSWLNCQPDNIMKRIFDELHKKGISLDQVSIIYQTITDLSFSRGGACIGIVNENEIQNDSKELYNMIEAGLLSKKENDDKKISAIRNLISYPDKSFYKLDRKMRQELLELDGATIFSISGEILAVGTIIKLEGSGSDGGGRTAAAKQLSNHGLAIKISQDGYVQFFKQTKEIMKILI